MKTKKVIIVVMLVLIMIMAVGYAAFVTNLSINGTANVSSSWKVVFTDITQISKTDGIIIKENPTASGTTATFNVGLTSPGDSIEYQITVENQGTIDAIIENITASETGNEAIKFEISNIKIGNILEKSASTTFNVKISYDESVTSQPERLVNQLTIDINYVQNLGQDITVSDPVIEKEIELLTSKILRDNTAQSDGVINFSKPSYYISSYTPNIPDISESAGVVSLTFSTSTNYYWGSTYTFNSSTGLYTLSGTKTAKWDGTWNTTLQSYAYTCGSTATSCTTLYKIYTVDSTTAGTAHAFTRTANYTTNGQGLYYTSTGTESGKTTYYFRGNVTNNYVKFAKDSEGNDLYWKIIRINEDGSVRVIYQGTSADATGSNAQIGTSVFNSPSSDNAYVGYMYGTVGSSTYAATHANTNDSTIKDVLDDWYVDNLKTNYSGYLADAGFCNDRSVVSGLGYGTKTTYYGPYNRSYTNQTPQFECPNASNDLFTTSTSNKGNKALTNPIGLITADEVAYAGGMYALVNENYYLYTGNYYWTMSPGNRSSSNARGFFVTTGGYLQDYNNSYDYGVRPVINLKPTVEVTLEGTGDSGSSTNPYVVITN